MRNHLPPDLVTAARLGGEMGRRFAEADWAAHPLGPVDTWPVETRAAVAAALTSRFPIVLWLSREDLFLVYNDAYIAALGDKHPAALGRPGRQVWWDIWDEIGPMLRGVLDTGEATWSDDLMLPLVTEGRRHERYFTFSYGPLVGSAGDVNGIFCAVTETTERVLAARRLHILNTVSAALLGTQTAAEAVAAAVTACGDSHPDLPFVAVYLIDSGTGLAELRECSPSVRQLLPSILGGLKAVPAADGASIVEDLPEVAPGLAGAFGELCPQQALILPLADPGPYGELGALVVGLNPRRILDEQYRGFCGLLADQVSGALSTVASYEMQRRRADALAELDRAKTTFLTNVSHEFRTPLTLLLGPLQDAIAEASGDPAGQARLEMAHRNANRLLRLVNALLDFSRIEAGRAGAEPVPVDLGALTAQVASSFTELCQRAGISLMLSCRPAIARVDVAMWETIVLNLLSNAVKFTLSGSITVVVKPGPQTVRVQVIDTGIGVDPADLPHLFDRFYRATNARGRSVEGSGVGLSMVRSLVELHDGTIRVDSEPDVGTTVTIDLPAESTAAAAAAPPAPLTVAGNNPYLAEAEQWIAAAAPIAAASSGGRPLVLIADDNPDMREYIRQILASRWDTVVYADGKTALDGVRRHQPDLVLADAMMPGIDGFQLVSSIRADETVAAIPVILVSARAGVEASGDGLAAGADDYLTKPFSSADLVHRVQARLAAVRRTRDADRSTRRESAMAAVTTALTAAGSVDEALSALIAAPEATLGATAIAVGLLEDDHLTVLYDGAIDAELKERYHVIALDAPVPVADVATSGQAMIIPDAASLDERYATAVRDAAPGIQAGQIHPLRDGNGIVIGALGLLWPQPQAFTAADLAQGEQLAALTATAIARIRTAEREHRIATDFQEQLLDLDLTSKAVVVSAVYQPAAETMRVGGDWYLVTPLDETDQVAVTVGDVVGNGLTAATVMSRLRAATAASALTDGDPARVLTTVQRYAARVPGGRCCTLAYARIDRRRDELDYICAGHPYPLLIEPDGTVRLLDEGREPSLAAFGLTLEGVPGHASFPPGSLLVLYTDGLIERRGESLDDGLARLAAVAPGLHRLPVGMVGRELRQLLAPSGGFSDDVVILAVRPTGTTADSHVTAFAADPATMRSARHGLEAWLARLNLPEQQQHDILLSVGEAITNAVRHGSHRDPDKTVSLEVFAEPGQVTATVGDSGQWTADSAASRRETPGGRGLTLMHGLSDGVVITRGAHGTQATLRFTRSREMATTFDT